MSRTKSQPDPPAEKPKTTRGSKGKAVTPDPVAVQEEDTSVKSSSFRSDVTSKKDNSMSDDNILSYSDDISEAEAPAPLPPGDYPAEIRGATRKTSAKGNEMVPVTILISPDHYPADYPVENAPDGTTLTYQRLMYEDNARGQYRMRKFCESIGAPTGKAVNPNDWIGRQVVVTVGNEEYEGERRANIMKFSSAD
jgi:hypothetical protein